MNVATEDCRGLMVHKNDGSVHTSVLKSQFYIFSLQQGGEINTITSSFTFSFNVLYVG